jgi:hypothetical protein
MPRCVQKISTSFPGTSKGSQENENVCKKSQTPSIVFLYAKGY